MRAAHDSRLDGFDLAAAGRDFTWQQQIVISAVGSNRSRLVVAGCRLAGCGLRLPCSVVSLFVFVFVICEVVADRQRCAACGFYSSMCAAAYVTMCVWLSGWQLVTSVLVFCVCAVQQHDKFKFVSRDKFLSLFLSHPLSLQNLSKEAVMGDASHAFVHLHAMLVADKSISASPNSTFVKALQYKAGIYKQMPNSLINIQNAI
ncbi:hypothetical protein WN944_028992 [Citrus x changshan-huyou]|uniref:Uncharacterized protein n=1 Tax=Citrus x changshan-huyou TaxID=2935761 RepID=A0AAP0QAP1_9ROSI